MNGRAPPRTARTPSTATRTATIRSRFSTVIYGAGRRESSPDVAPADAPAPPAVLAPWTALSVPAPEDAGRADAGAAQPRRWRPPARGRHRGSGRRLSPPVRAEQLQALPRRFARVGLPVV